MDEGRTWTSGCGCLMYLVLAAADVYILFHFSFGAAVGAVIAEAVALFIVIPLLLPVVGVSAAVARLPVRVLRCFRPISSIRFGRAWRKLKCDEGFGDYDARSRKTMEQMWRESFAPYGWNAESMLAGYAIQRPEDAVELRAAWDWWRGNDFIADDLFGSFEYRLLDYCVNQKPLSVFAKKYLSDLAAGGELVSPWGRPMSRERLLFNQAWEALRCGEVLGSEVRDERMVQRLSHWASSNRSAADMLAAYIARHEHPEAVAEFRAVWDEHLATWDPDGTHSLYDDFEVWLTEWFMWWQPHGRSAKDYIMQKMMAIRPLPRVE